MFLFVFAPLAELYVLIEVGSEIGALPTILLSIFTAILGASLVRLQGFSVLMRARGMMARGEAPAIEMMEGMALAITGFALLLPGFITDAIGFLLLITPIRRALIIKGLLRGGVMRPASG
ncbi:MAG: FxsA family protein, partial [Sedimenticolaceae bacterium]